MSGLFSASSLNEFLKFAKKQYIVSRADKGGTAKGFRDYIAFMLQEDDGIGLAKKWAFAAFMEAASKTWEAQPRKRGPDLFATPGGFTFAESFTRRSAVDPDDFEKVDQQFATIQDVYYDAELKMAKAQESVAAADRQITAADEIKELAGGDTSIFLRDICS